MITDNRQITEHFHSSEFVCQHCGNIYIQEELVQKLETLFAKLHASKCIISSGYRCRDYDIQIGGFAGRHSEGLASDCIYYDENGAIIPSKIVICVAWDMKLLNGIANIDGNYSHLDNRTYGTYYGDETRGNSSMWSNPYEYFGVSKEEVRKYTKEETSPMAIYQTYSNKSGAYYTEVVDDSDFAGGSSLDDNVGGFRVKLSNNEEITYQAHILNGNWLPKVSSNSYKTNDTSDGDSYAGIYGQSIDGIAIYSNRDISYRVFANGMWYEWVNSRNADINNEISGFAGVYGQAITRIQIKSN